MQFTTISTPCLLIDEAVMRRNMQRMQAACTRTGCGLRPHVKTHKCPELALMQLELGACGITVAKLREAEIMADAGITDMFMAYPLVGADKIERAVALAQRVRLILSADAYSPAQALSRAAVEAGITLELRLELDSGMGRSGAAMEQALSLAERINALPGLKLSGISTYRNMICQGRPDPDREKCGLDEGRIMVELATAMRQIGLPIEEVSVGSTATAESCAKVCGVTEVRPGTYVFQDPMQVHKGACSDADMAAFVETTVISVQGERVVIDAGNKSLSADCPPNSPPFHFSGYGRVAGHDALTLYAMTEEHGMLHNPDASDVIQVGDRLRIYPNHICTTVNLYDKAYLLRGGRVERILRIAARGAND